VFLSVWPAIATQLVTRLRLALCASCALLSRSFHLLVGPNLDKTIATGRPSKVDAVCRRCCTFLAARQVREGAVA
jgi:hypothetical protein